MLIIMTAHQENAALDVILVVVQTHDATCQDTPLADKFLDVECLRLGVHWLQHSGQAMHCCQCASQHSSHAEAPFGGTGCMLTLLVVDSAVAQHRRCNHGSVQMHLPTRSMLALVRATIRISCAHQEQEIGVMFRYRCWTHYLVIQHDVHPL